MFKMRPLVILLGFFLLTPNSAYSSGSAMLECEIALLSKGTDSFQARVRSIRNAKRSIRIRALIFSGDETGWFFAEELKKKAKEFAGDPDKKVIVMVDAISNLNVKAQVMLNDMRMHGVEVEGYEIPLMYLADIVTEFDITHPTLLNKRFHQKQWIIDGEEPGGSNIMGGLNIANEYFRIGGDVEKLWRDQDVLVTGDAMVKKMVDEFDEDYLALKALKDSKPDILNTDITFKAWTWVLKKTVALLNAKDQVRFIKNAFLWKTLDRLTRKEVELFAEEAMDKEKFNPKMVTASAEFLHSRPRHKETDIHDKYLEEFNRVQPGDGEILVANAYFLPRIQLRRAFKDAVRRGVPVKIITNSMQTNDLKQLSLVARYLYHDLLSVNFEPQVAARGPEGAKLEIYEWVGDETYWTMHSKFALFGNDRGMIGSYNMDPRSELLNAETALHFIQPNAVRELADTFYHEDLQRSLKVEFDEAVEYKDPDNPIDNLSLQLAKLFKNQM